MSCVGGKVNYGKSTTVMISLTAAAAILCTLPMVGCHTVGKSAKQMAIALNIIDEPKIPPIGETPKAYREALAMIDAGQFSEALEALKQFLQREPTTPWSQAVIFNQGRAFEGLAQWTEAAEHYRSVAVVTANRAPRLQAHALYRLSFCYEALNRYPDVVATLNDVYPLKSNLDREIAEAELPARLAGAYASVGNYDQADHFYKVAEAGISHLKHQKEMSQVPGWLPKTLYFMGSMSLRNTNWSDFEASMRPLPRAQIYLLQAAELGSEPWSTEAMKDLTGFYQKLWNVIERAPVPPISDPLLARRQIQQRQWDLAALVHESLQALKAYNLPDVAAPSEQSKKILSFVGQLEGQIGELYAQRPAGEGQTRESLERQRRVRARVVAPDDFLEKQYRQRSSSAPDQTGVQPLHDSVEQTGQSSIEAQSEGTQSSSNTPKELPKTLPEKIPPKLPGTNIPEVERHETAPINMDQHVIDTQDPNL
jgi:tetratricopeptide (TPR) repeat protein